MVWARGHGPPRGQTPAAPVIEADRTCAENPRDWHVPQNPTHLIGISGLARRGQRCVSVLVDEISKRPLTNSDPIIFTTDEHRALKSEKTFLGVVKQGAERQVACFSESAIRHLRPLSMPAAAVSREKPAESVAVSPQRPPLELCQHSLTSPYSRPCHCRKQGRRARRTGIPGIADARGLERGSATSPPAGK